MSYHGLVVGGDLSGKWRSHDRPAFWEDWPAGGTIPMPGGHVLHWDGVPGGTKYVHVTAPPNAQFWVPEGKDAAWAMAEVERCLHSAHASPLRTQRS